MKRRKIVGYMKSFAVIVLVLTLLTGCSFSFDDWYFINGKWKEDFGYSAVDEDLSFDDFLNELFAEAVNTDTMTLHFFLADPERAGIIPGPVTLGTFEAVDVKENLESIKACRRQLAIYSREELTEEQQITMDILQEYLDMLEKDNRMQYYYEPLKQGMGIHASLPYSFAEYTFYDKEDVEDYLVLLGETDAYFESVMVFERQKAAEGLFMPDENLDIVLEECADFLDASEEDFFLRSSFAERLEELGGLTEEEKADYIGRNDTLLKSDFVKAYELLIEELKEMRGEGKNDQGLCYYPEGREYYEFLIESNIGSTYGSVDNLADALYEDVLDIVNEARNILYGGDDSVLNEVMQEIPETRGPEEILNDLRTKYAEDFPIAAESGCRIKKVSPSMEDMMNPAFYMIPVIDRHDQNVIYINEKKLSEGVYDLYTVLAHEGYPGHLYQNLMYYEKERSPFRAVMQYSGYSEGWGTYAELYSYRWKDNLSEGARRVNCLTERLNMAFSAYVDICINYYGMSREEALELCEDWLGIDDEDVVNDLYAYVISDPAGYLDYYIGYMEIQKMAGRAENVLGENFSVKEFHRFIMDFGPAPFHVMQPYFEEWLNEQKEAAF